MKRHSHIYSFLLTVVSIPLVLLIQQFGSTNAYAIKNYLIISVCLVIVGLSAYWEYGEYKNEKLMAEEEEKRSRDRQIELRNARAKTVISQINHLMERKAECYRKYTYADKLQEARGPIIYDVEDYIREICENMRTTVAEIIHNESDHVEVTLIYRYADDTNWQWLAGRSGISGAIDLNEYVANPETLYHYLLNHLEETPLFSNQKENCPYYKPNRRDRVFANHGSFYAMPVTFTNNDEGLIESILLVGTYGITFIPQDAGHDKEQEFMRIMANEIIPYYTALLQTEFGAMYLRRKMEERDLANESAE